MLTATEVLTWRAPLKKAARLFLHSKEDAAGGKLNDKSDDWQYVSGQHWWCKVLFTQPSKKTWPVTMPDGQQGAGFPSATQPALHRQLRIIVESGSMESNDFPSASVQSWSTSYSQSPGGSGSIVASARSSSSHPWARMVLDDVDLVRINQRYFHTNRRLDAVRVFHQDLQVGIWYLDEHDPEKSYRIQLIFRKEEDKKTFLALVEPDSSVEAFPKCTGSQPVENVADEQTVNQKPTDRDDPVGGRTRDESSKPAALQQVPHQSQSLGDTLLQMAKSRVDLEKAERATVENFTLTFNHQGPIRETSVIGCPSCAHVAPHEQSIFSIANGAPSSSYDTSSNSTFVSVGDDREETPLTDVEMEEVVDEYEYEDPGMWGWPNSRAVECIQDDVCRLCFADPNLEWIIAQCVDEHFRNIEYD